MEIYQIQRNTQTRWISPENPQGEKGGGGKTNKGAKGHACDFIKPGETKVLFDVQGCGIIHRIWMTIGEVSILSPKMLRSLRIEIFWEGEEKPAVSAPLGDFFGIGLGRRVAFDSALFSDPEGRSFNSNVQMPFRKHGKITISNDSTEHPIVIFYEVNYSLTEAHHKDTLYFHAYWNREIKTKLCKDFEILPKITGAGRFLGANMGMIADPVYGKSWWGEGEVKVYLDGDDEYPTLAGTGAEDYPGSAYGIGPYANTYQGCPIADEENMQYAFYRYHIPDPVFFQKECRITIQQIGGGLKKELLEMKEKGGAVKAVGVFKGITHRRLLDEGVELEDSSIDMDTWTIFCREDDWSSTAYFYLDAPVSELPALANVAERTAGLSDTRL